MIRKLRRHKVALRALAIAGATAVVTVSGTAAYGAQRSENSTSVSGGAITVALNGATVSLDPLGTQSVSPATVEPDLQVFDTLVKQGTKAGTYVPDLATSWTHPSPDVWRFNLNRNAKFANGKPVTGDDVVASLEALVQEKGPASALWSLLDTTRAPNPHTVVITTTAQMGTMLNALSWLFVVPANQINNTSYWNAPYGSGPFKVKSFTPDESVVLVRNPHYWGTPAKLKSVNFISVANDSDETAYLKSGQLNASLSISPEQVPQLKGTKGLTISSIPSYSYYFLWFNNSSPPFNNTLVRQAMWYALPLQSIIPAIWGKYGSVATSAIPSTVFGYHSEPAYGYNPGKAKRLLAEAGYPNGFSTTIQFSPTQAPYLQTMLSLFASAWSAIGVNVNLEADDPATYSSNQQALKWNMIFQENTVTTGDADYTLGRLYVSSADRLGFKNSYVDSLILQAKESVNPLLRERLYAKVLNVLWTQAVGIFPVQANLVTAWQTRYTGIVPSPSGYISFANVSVK